MGVYKAVGSAITQFVHDLNGKVILDTDGNGNGSPVADYMYVAGNLVAEYKNSTTYFAHPDHISSTRLMTGLNQSVIQNVDYLPFGEGTSDSPAVPVANPGFESGSSNWALGFWGCNSSITTTQAHSGSASLAQTGSVTGGSYQDMGGVVSGNNYQVSVWVRANSGTTAQAMLWVHDTTGGNSVQSTAFTPGTSWQQVTLTFTGDNTNQMRIHLYFSAGSGTIYYDDVQVQLINPVGDTGITTHKFTGLERDDETNLDHTLFRKYSSNLGRWMTPDPAGLAAVDPTNPQSWNRYSYVRNMPVMLTDPFGLCPPVAQNRDSSDSQDTKSGGPSATDSGDLTEADPQGAAGGTCQSSPWYFTLGGGGGGWGSWGGAAGGLDGGYNGDDSGFGVGSPIGFGGGIGSQLELVQFAFTPTGVYRFSATVNNEPVWLTGVLYGNSDLLSLLAGFQAPSGNGGGGRGVSNRPTGNPCLKSYSSSTLGKVVGLVSPVTLISDAKEVWMEWTLLPAAKYATLTGLKNASSAVGNTELLSLTNPGASVTIEAPTAAGIDALESAAANPITLLAIPFATAFDAGMRNTCSQLPNFMPPKF